ncbi:MULTISPECIES: IS3 family transposase [Leuconostoc gelidum group]
MKREIIYQFRFSPIAHLIFDVDKYINWFKNKEISITN